MPSKLYSINNQAQNVVNAFKIKNSTSIKQAYYYITKVKQRGAGMRISLPLDIYISIHGRSYPMKVSTLFQ